MGQRCGKEQKRGRRMSGWSPDKLEGADMRWEVEAAFHTSEYTNHDTTAVCTWAYAQSQGRLRKVKLANTIIHNLHGSVGGQPCSSVFERVSMHVKDF